ncbi:MAG: hypothetical protein MZU79_08900 [Anaerotruncus sp.]|nr:hypothetical protein [Anaerotruncus sp.]
MNMECVVAGAGAIRTARLRNRLMAVEPSVCHERATVVTEVYERLGDSLPPILLRAHAPAAVLERMSLRIEPDELIVGNQAGRPRSAPIFPEYSWEWIIEELDSLPMRAADRFAVPAETRQALQDILPKWRGKSFRDRAVRALPEEVLRSHQSLLFLLTSMGCGVGHLAPDYSRVLSRGLAGIAEEARQRLGALDLTDPDAIGKRDFCQAAAIVAEAAIRFANRFAELAERLAEAGAAPERRGELAEIARICRKVPSTGLPRRFTRRCNLSGSCTSSSTSSRTVTPSRPGDSTSTWLRSTRRILRRGTSTARAPWSCSTVSGSSSTRS